MSRDLSTYQENYLEHPYESIQTSIRKNHVIDWLQENQLLEGSILEIGCGDDSIVNRMKGFEHFQIVEPASKFYATALGHAEDHQDKERIKVSNCLAEDFEKEISIDYDVVIVSCLLHEIQDQSAFLKKIKSLMSPKTLLYLDVPNANSFHRVLAVELGLIEDVFQKSESQKRLQQNDFFSVDTLGELMTSHKFNVTNMATMIFKPFTHSQMQSLLDKGTFTKEFLFGLSRMSKYVPDYGSEIFVVAKL